MAKIKYLYDEKTATFTPVKSSNKNYWFFGIFGFLLISSLVLIAFRLKGVSSDNKHQQELAELKLHYEELSEQADLSQKELEQIKKKDNEIYRTYFQLDSISMDERLAGTGGVDKFEKYAKLGFGELVTITAKKIDNLNNQLKVQEKSLNEIITVAKNKEEYFSKIPAIQPIANNDLKRLASGFGKRFHPILHVVKFHEGIDFTAEIGTPIYATADGIIERAGVQSGYGNAVVIDHQNGYKTLYAHQSKIKAKEGQVVKRGEIIGYVGNTGLSSGPHLHYEIIKNNVKIDPLGYFYQDLSAEEYNELAKISQEMKFSFD